PSVYRITVLIQPTIIQAWVITGFSVCPPPTIPIHLFPVYYSLTAAYAGFTYFAARIIRCKTAAISKVIT
ncbi:MAG: hypothetical protein QXL94_07515, partial [Candidatus Parvarchaeum sp.]